MKNGEYSGLLIDRQALQDDSFIDTLVNTLSSIITTGNEPISAEYSYKLTDLIRSELNALLKNPETKEQLKVLESLYNE